MTRESSSTRLTPVLPGDDGDPARRVRHEVRNHLTTVVNATHFVRARLRASGTLDAEPRVARFLEMIEQAMDRANAELDGLRDGRAPRELGEDADTEG